MTIPTKLNIASLNDRLTDLETCADNAPDGTFVVAKAVAGIVGDISNQLLAALRELGLGADNSDRLRTVEAVVYGYILASNPDLGQLASAEGFGDAMNGPAADRVRANLTRGRDFLRGLKS